MSHELLQEAAELIAKSDQLLSEDAPGKFVSGQTGADHVGRVAPNFS